MTDKAVDFRRELPLEWAGFPAQNIVVLRSRRNTGCTDSALSFVPDSQNAFLRDKISRCESAGRGR